MCGPARSSVSSIDAADEAGAAWRIPRCLKTFCWGLMEFADSRRLPQAVEQADSASVRQDAEALGDELDMSGSGSRCAVSERLVGWIVGQAHSCLVGDKEC